MTMPIPIPREGSDSNAPALPASPPRRAIRVVPPPRTQAPRAPFVAVVLMMLLVGLGGLLMLNMLLAQGSFSVRDLNRQVAVMADRQQALEHRVAALDAPRLLARKAAGLGMVPVENPAFLRSRDGKVLGVPVAATGSAPPAAVMIDPKERRAGLSSQSEPAR